MDARKVVRFQLDNGEWRSKVYIFNSNTNQYEEEVKDEYAGWYDKNKYENYIYYLMGIEKEKPKQEAKENKTLFNRKINVSWDKLQPELTSESQKFSAEAHEYLPEELIEILNNENATKNIERLSKMSQEEVEAEYKYTNRLALSNRDNIEQLVNAAFLKGEGLKDITINGKKYKGLLFDENSEQSQRLKKNGTFKAYYDKYLSCLKDIISETCDAKEIDIEAISQKLSTKLGKPNFSKKGEVFFYDYYGLMGGTQNIEVNFEITPTSNGEYTIKTTMYINDWYGADEDDINKKINYKNLASSIMHVAWDVSKFPFGYKSIPNDINNLISNIEDAKLNSKDAVKGLQSFFYLQHHHGCKPFPTQIIHKSTDTIIFKD